MSEETTPPSTGANRAERGGDPVPGRGTREAAAEFGELPAGSPTGSPAALSVLYGLSMPVAIELGRTKMSVQEILTLGRGSVIQLDRLAGEPIDVFVGDRKFAEGEVVVVGEQFGVRLTRVVGKPGEGSQEAVA